jgi:Kelch motif
MLISRRHENRFSTASHDDAPHVSERRRARAGLARLIRPLALLVLAAVLTGLRAPGSVRAGWGDGGGQPMFTQLAQLTVPRSNLAVTAGIDGSGSPVIYAIGGSNFPLGTVIVPSPVEQYSPGPDQWMQVAPLNHPRDQLAAASLNGKVYAIGGANPSGDPTGLYAPYVEAYDPTSGAWSDMAKLNVPRRNLAAVAVGNKIYAIGGCCDTNGPFDTVEVYDPNTNTWTVDTQHSLPLKRTKLAATVSNATIYAIGGVVCDGDCTIANADPSVLAWDTSSGAGWSGVASLPEPREQLKAFSDDSSTVYAVGGTPSKCENAVTCTPFGISSLSNGQWTFFSSLGSNRSIFGAAYLSGVLYLIGGSDGTDALFTALSLPVTPAPTAPPPSASPTP